MMVAQRFLVAQSTQCLDSLCTGIEDFNYFLTIEMLLELCHLDLF